MKKSIYLLLLIVLVNWTRVQAQDALRYAIEKSLFANLPNRGVQLMKTESYKNKGFIFGMAVGVNKSGLVDTVIFSNQTKELDSIVNFAEVTQALKKNKTDFRNQKNSLLVTNVLVRRAWDSQLDNVEALDKYFNHLLPKLGGLQNTRKVKLIRTINMTQRRPQP